jgi:hypothetical protein
MDKLFIHHHLGLGDHLDCNGMVRYIAEHAGHEKVAVFSKSNYFSMIDYMYRDTDSIEVIEISKDNEYADVKRIADGSRLLVVGHQFYPGKEAELSRNKNCWEFFYEQIQIPYSVRYNSFHVERDPEEEERVFNKLNPDNEPYIFIHEDAARGFLLDRDYFIDKDLKVIENDVTENIFHFTKILEEAQEIHCMESSFKTLIDFYCEQDNIFYHDIRESQPLGQHSSPKWTVIQYG